MDNTQHKNGETSEQRRRRGSDMLAFSFPGLFEGPELPSPESTAPGTLFKLKELVNGVPRATLYIFSNEGKWLKIEDDSVGVLAQQICQLPPSERLRLLEYLGDHFCLHCGYNYNEDGSPLSSHNTRSGNRACQCWNDE